MTEAEARAQIEMLVEASVDPFLDPAEIDHLIARARRADADSNPPTSVDWAPTWDINAAAAEGWRMKAAKAAGRFDFTTDGQTFQRSQLVAHCTQQNRIFLRRMAMRVG